MDNKDFLEKLKFGVGDGCLQYYLYNWKCADIHSHMVSHAYTAAVVDQAHVWIWGELELERQGQMG